MGQAILMGLAESELQEEYVKDRALLTGNALLMLLKLLFRWMKVPTGRNPRTV